MLDLIAREFEFNTGAEFGETVTLTPAGGEAFSIKAIVERTSQAVEMGDTIQIDGVSYIVQAPADAVSSISHGDLAAYAGQSLRVVAIEQMRAGRTRLMLAA